jgi:hypothetical protein
MVNGWQKLLMQARPLREAEVSGLAGEAVLPITYYLKPMPDVSGGAYTLSLMPSTFSLN